MCGGLAWVFRPEISVHLDITPPIKRSKLKRISKDPLSVNFGKNFVIWGEGMQFFQTFGKSFKNSLNSWQNDSNEILKQVQC